MLIVLVFAAHTVVLSRSSSSQSREPEEGNLPLHAVISHEQRNPYTALEGQGQGAQSVGSHWSAIPTVVDQ